MGIVFNNQLTHHFRPTMKYDTTVSSARRKQRRARFSADSAERRRRMCAPLSRELRSQHKGVKSMPIRKDDEVMVIRGDHKGREGKVIQVYRKKWAIHVEKVTREKANGAVVHIPFDASKLVITKLKLDNDRNNLLARKAAGREGSDKHSEGGVSAMS